MFLTLILIVLFIFLCIRFRTSKGRFGEKKVARILSRLPKEDYKVINDLLLRTPSSGTTQIDHIVISEYAIFVIETKFYKGWIYGGANSEYWTQNIYGNKYSLRNPIHQNEGHIRVLRQLLKSYGDIPFISIIAFSPQASISVTSDTPVIYWNQIRNLISRYREKVIPRTTTSRIYNKLLEYNLPGTKENRKEHINNVRTNERNRNLAVASGKCPRCGGTLIRRNGKYGTFYGCSNYPRCKYTTH